MTKMRKVQAVVRSVPALVWKPCLSKCYRAKMSDGVRFTFDYINMNPGVTKNDPNKDVAVKMLAQDVRTALTAEGYEGFEVNVDYWTWGVDPYVHPIVLVYMPASQL